MELKDIKEQVDTVHKLFEDFKAANDARFDELKKKGVTDPVLAEKVDNINADLGEAIKSRDEMLKRIDAAETAAARKAKTGDADGKLEAKAAEFAKLVATVRKERPDFENAVENLTAYKGSFDGYLRKGDIHLTPDQMKALSVGSDPDGGYVVDPDTSGRIVQKVFETSPMRQVASVQVIGTDALEGMFDLNEAGAEWVGETQTRSETDTPQIGRWRIPVHELSAKPHATQKLLDDASINMEAWLAAKVADKFARTENAAFVSGDGVGKPRGFLTYADGTTLPGTIERVVSGANGAFKAAPDGGDALIDVVYKLKSAYRTGARWAMNSTTFAAARKLKDSDGAYIWQPGIAAGEPAGLLGFPVMEFQDMPAHTDTGALAVAFANWAEAYQIVDRQGVRVLRDPYSSKPYVMFYTTKRTGGDVVNFEAIKLVEFSQS